MLAGTIFIITYIGVALGRIPGLAIDRVGIALLGAIAMVVFGVLSLESAVKAIDLPTILLLYALMIISAQLRLGGFYTWSASRLAFMTSRPRLFLLAVMLTSALLSAVLANDIICFAFTPVLAMVLRDEKMNPLPFLLALALASNIGSAATIIGNPQNMLIGQVGRLHFGQFMMWCAPPSLLALLGSYLILLLIYRDKFFNPPPYGHRPIEHPLPGLDRWQTCKGLGAIGLLVALFFTPIAREISAIAVAGVLLCSRKLRTRVILGLVDWHLITLFCALFVVIKGLSQENWPAMVAMHLSHWGTDLHNLYTLSGVSVLLSNLVSNVPATMLLVQFLDPFKSLEWFTLAVSSTFAGNLIIIGSIANLIVVEQAANFGITVRFKDHAVVGVPVTLWSLAALGFWIIV